MARYVSLRGFARLRGITTATVQKWRDQGHLVYDTRGRVDVVESNKRLAERPEVYRGGKLGGNPPAGKSHTRDDVRDSIARKEYYLAKKHEIEVRKQLRELVLIEDVSKLFVQAFTLIRTRIIAMPTQLAPDMVGLKHPAEAQRIMMAGVNDLLTELCSYTGDFEEIDSPAANVAVAKRRILNAAARGG